MGLSNPSYFITTKNKKNMENPIIVPFDLNTARKIKSGEIEGSVLIKLYIITKLKYVEKRVLDTFKENGVDLDNYTHCVIVKRNFYLAW